jgi:hypothetical protein
VRSVGPGRGAGLLSMVLGLTLVVAPAGRAAATVCERIADGEQRGVLEVDGLEELSGLAASRRHPGAWWAHGDSGAGAVLWALDDGGSPLGRFTLAGATNRDWEDLAAGPSGEGGSFLYVGDIGDNTASRESVTVYRVAEPTDLLVGAGGELPVHATVVLRLPDGPADAETLIVDPRSGDLYVVTKRWDGVSLVLRAAADRLVDGADLLLEPAGEVRVPAAALLGAVGGGLPGTLVTAGDVSPDGSVVLLRTYGAVLAYERPDGAPLHHAFRAPPGTAPQRDEAQGEAIAFSATGDAYRTIGEGRGAAVHHFTIEASPDEPVAAGRAPPAPSTPRTRRWVVPASAAAATGLLGLLVLRSRRRQRP